VKKPASGIGGIDMDWNGRLREKGAANYSGRKSSEKSHIFSLPEKASGFNSDRLQQRLWLRFYRPSYLNPGPVDSYELLAVAAPS
jgi:hypothetical protein